jgi:protein-tyrosine-phosphatase
VPGSARERARAQRKAPQAQGIQKKSILFVCIGNICRSPMAEALARKYGADVLTAQSAGLAPAVTTTPHTRQILAERNVDLGDHRPRGLDEVELSRVDMVINMSGMSLPTGLQAPLEVWNVPDPYGSDVPAYRRACDLIEHQVMRLILRARSGKL